MNSGIYELIDPLTNARLYLGQSVNLDKRPKAHIGKLKRGHHTILELQAYVDVNGLPEIRIVEKCSREELNVKELAHFEAKEPLFWRQRPHLAYNYTGDPGALTKEKKCAICGELFMAKMPNARFCSEPCHYEGRKRKHNCKYCGVEFLSFSTRSDWCSTQCRLDFKKQNITCPGCGKKFSSNGAKYCSTKCSPKSSHSQICSNCGKAFASARPVAIFCSAKCRHDRTFTCTCRECGRQFEARHANARLCSTECGSQVLRYREPV